MASMLVFITWIVPPLFSSRTVAFCLVYFTIFSDLAAVRATALANVAEEEEAGASDWLEDAAPVGA